MSARGTQRRFLWRRERTILLSLAEVLLGWTLQVPEGEQDRLVEAIDKHLRCMPFEKRLLYRLCLWLFEVGALTYYASFRLMSRMDLRKRTRYIEAWHNTWWSTKRVIKRFVEVIVFMNYYALPEVAARVGYVPSFKHPYREPAFPRQNLMTTIPARDIELGADVCVIGSGAGGSALALELADKGRRVVVLEEGKWHGVDELGQDTMTMTRLLYREGGAVVSYGWPFIVIPVGRCVGGTTFINSGTCFRPPRAVLRRWVDEFGLSGWEYDRLVPAIERVEGIMGVTTARDDVQGPSGKLAKKGFEALGYACEPLDRNVPNCCGSGVCVQGCPTNAKQSCQISYLPRAMHSGAMVLTQVRVHRITRRGHHATGVEGRFIEPHTGFKGPCVKVKARVVVSACGTLYTPLLLSRSRIPDPGGRRGRHLTLHPASKVYGIFDHEVRGWEGIPQGYFSDALAEEGIKCEGVFLTPAYTASTILMMGQPHREVMDRYSSLACFGMIVSDSTEGRVMRLMGDSPLVWYNINRADLKKYKRGYQLLAEVFFAAGAQKIYPGIKTLPVVSREQGAQAIERLPLRNKDLDLQAFHPLGTCRMGADPRKAVVDGHGQLYGMDNVFVADGSIFPTSLGVNPMITIMAAATKIAQIIHNKHL